MNFAELKKIYLQIGIALCIAFVVASCTKEKDPPANPYDGINYNTDTTAKTEPDPNSIVGIHKNILRTKCSLPGCHDGTFEPDFRSVQSAFSTLVWQKVKKVTVNGIDTFQYRVVPYQINQSFIHERITTTTTEYMPSNGTRLSQDEINHINNWISSGAPDENGVITAPPNNQPNVVGYLATDLAYNRIDSIRKDNISYNPFLVQQNQSFLLFFLIQDDSTDASQLLVNQIKLSTDKDDFSSAQILNAAFVNLGGFMVWTATVNASLWSQGQTVYFRYYVNDGDHTNNIEFPNTNSAFYYKTIYAFYIQ